MQYRTLGRTGIKVTPYALGAMMLGSMGNPDRQQGIAIIRRALERNIPIRQLTSEMTVYDRPAHFRDSLVRGAFARFHHDHFFLSREGGTLVRDVFEYRAPLGALGWIAERLFLTAYMRRFLETRLIALKRMAESEAWVQFVPPTS